MFNNLLNCRFINQSNTFAKEGEVMDIFSIGKVADLTKNTDMKARWNEKKKKGDFQSESKKTELQRKNDSFKAYWYDKQKNEESDKTLESINNKVAAGKDLTPEEMRYLESKNPMLYKKLKQDKEEQKAFEHDLKKCKTKDEVERLKTDTVSKSLTVIGSVKNNPNIPEGTKAAIAASEMQKLKKLEEISAKFVDSGEYAKLPTESEVRMAEKEITEAEQAERKRPDDEDISERTDDEGREVSDKEAGVTAESVSTAEKVLPEEEKTVIEAENTPEAQKMKRAKVKKAYIEIQEKTDSFAAVSHNADTFIKK